MCTLLDVLQLTQLVVEPMVYCKNVGKSEVFHDSAPPVAPTRNNYGTSDVPLTEASMSFAPLSNCGCM